MVSCYFIQTGIKSDHMSVFCMVRRMIFSRTPKIKQLFGNHLGVSFLGTQEKMKGEQGTSSRKVLT